MKEFELSPKMLTLGGTFYPTGYAFIMFPDVEDARQVARQLEPNVREIMLLTPATILKEIGNADGDSSVALPSVGTEGATMHKYITLAEEGHSALMIAVPTSAVTERVMSVVRQFPFSYAQKYHTLAIEDLE